MNLNRIISEKEQEAVVNLIKAHKAEQVARYNLTEATYALRRASKEVDKLYLAVERDEKGKPVENEYGGLNQLTSLPEEFVIDLDGEYWLITLEREDEELVQVRLIGGVLELDTK
jgi:hypothetical protein